ncbi:MAG: hypothetical protein RL767_165 [Bacteroidota bacterium]
MPQCGDYRVRIIKYSIRGPQNNAARVRFRPLRSQRGIGKQPVAIQSVEPINRAMAEGTVPVVEND